MIIVNTETVPGYEIVELCGLVQGNTIRAKHVGRDIAASLKNIVGGELKGYTELLTEARREALERMPALVVEHGWACWVALPRAPWQPPRIAQATQPRATRWMPAAGAAHRWAP